MQELTEADYKKAEKNGISRFNAYQRVQTYGWSVKEAITVPVRGQKSPSMEYWLETARANGIASGTFMNRIRNGWGTVEAATKPPGSERRSTMYKFYPTEEDYKTAKANGIPKSLVKSRVFQHGWDVERAISQPHASTKRGGMYRRRAEKNGISGTLFCWRLRNGWSEEDASTVLPHGRARKRDPFAEFGVDEQDIKIAEMYGVSRNILLNRLKSNWNIDVAATTPPLKLGERRKFGLALKKQGDESIG